VVRDVVLGNLASRDVFFKDERVVSSCGFPESRLNKFKFGNSHRFVKVGKNAMMRVFELEVDFVQVNRKRG
jgi:hypothetical protein